MQQTEKYKLNLIEREDVFSPDPLNENAEKTDAALAAVVDEARAVNAELEGRVAALEAKKAVFGSYGGTGAYTQDITLGFTPKIAIVAPAMSTVACYTAILDSVRAHSSSLHNLKIVKNGFSVGPETNKSGYTYCYMAMG